MGAADAITLASPASSGVPDCVSLYWDELGEDISVRSDQDYPAAAPVLD